MLTVRNKSYNACENDPNAESGRTAQLVLIPRDLTLMLDCPVFTLFVLFLLVLDTLRIFDLTVDFRHYRLCSTTP